MPARVLHNSWLGCDVRPPLWGRIRDSVYFFIHLFKMSFFFRAEEGDAAFTEDADTRKLGRSHI